MADIEMRQVRSSNVEAVGYDADGRQLKVQFKGGSEYLYSDVPPEVFAALLDAQSVGSFLAREVAHNKAYKVVRLLRQPAGA